MTTKRKAKPAPKPADEPKGYNGWTNYETWAVALWIDNEKALYDESRRMVRASWDEADDTEDSDVLNHHGRARFALADALKGWVADMEPDLGATLWADLIGAALSEVNWDEIADNWLSEIKGYQPRRAGA